MKLYLNNVAEFLNLNTTYRVRLKIGTPALSRTQLSKIELGDKPIEIYLNCKDIYTKCAISKYSLVYYNSFILKNDTDLNSPYIDKDKNVFDYRYRKFLLDKYKLEYLNDLKPVLTKELKDLNTHIDEVVEGYVSEYREKVKKDVLQNFERDISCLEEQIKELDVFEKNNSVSNKENQIVEENAN